MLRRFLFYILFFSSISFFAQQDSLVVQYDKAEIEQLKFDKNTIEKYKNNKDFNYQEVKQEDGFFQQVSNWLNRILRRFFEWLFGVEKATGALKAFLSILPYLILAVVLYFLLKLFLKIDSKSLEFKQTEKATISLTDDEKLIKNEDINKLIDKAIADKHYRLAIRYYYVSILQKLAKFDLIDWQLEKTNEDYIKEIKKENLKDKFIKSTLLYDFVWYGNFEINESEFLKAQNEFNELKSLIK